MVTKTDLYPQWRRIVELDRGHLADAGIDLPVIPVSSFLRLRAWRAPALNAESGFAPLFDWLRAAVLEAAATEAVAAATPRRRVRPGAAARRRWPPSSRCWRSRRRRDGGRRGAAAPVTSAPGGSSTDGAGWQQVLFDGIQDLVADVEHDLAERLRTVVRDVEAVIDQGDPKDTWPDIEVWLQRQVVRRRERRTTSCSTSAPTQLAARSPSSSRWSPRSRSSWG